MKLTITCALLILSAPPAHGRKGTPKTLYMSKCATCHGPDGAGKTAKGKKLKVEDVRVTSTKMSVDDMIKIVNDGKGPDMDGLQQDSHKEQIKRPPVRSFVRTSSFRWALSCCWLFQPSLRK